MDSDFDPLTGVLSWRAFHERVDTLLPAQCEAILHVNIDHFIYSNALGYRFGDEFLRKAASLIREELPREALVGRVSGDGFSAALPAGVNSSKVAESIRHKVDENFLPDRIAVVLCAPRRGFITPPMSTTLTASLGIASWDCGVRYAVELVKAVSAACHCAKVAGRNRIRRALSFCPLEVCPVVESDAALERVFGDPADAERGLRRFEWTPVEREIILSIFESNRAIELTKLLSTARQRAIGLESPQDLWGLSDFLNEARKSLNAGYVTGDMALYDRLVELVHGKRVTPDQLAGISPEKIALVSLVAGAY